ncbi:hypothetical protein [Paenibacillus larvae]|uniref:hypothetical protein n=1 Tax=Paenibacillus larvae TaxID=1464 RepID=UPI00288D55DA|nr:hypothetical protein [Paenibacillus larvae]MDT2192022.1 hypothetical protein [Paenibacillus larvae]MDT2239311.1 hypothetical protein [Paenibacillus larvae]MDT2259720.1 hypothetical protein [Paenibacillus larvae]MDT2263743.1 hypothetical protein [Paenibacillus larvae]MDT2292551.1 hypothetical protein [Paenibacillus larvae]
MARIHFGSVQIGSISDSSAVHSGENHLIGWKQASKKMKASVNWGPEKPICKQQSRCM